MNGRFQGGGCQHIKRAPREPDPAVAVGEDSSAKDPKSHHEYV